ncbi:thiamine diphosphokinase [Oenococcus sp. UCMA 17063]|nr:thiamine diphosphokinase [Oenococcus sp. UCMA 17063]
MKSINILAGGPENNFPKNFSDFIKRENEWIGVDAGAFYLLNHGIKDVTAIGDFDSLTAKELSFVKSKVDLEHFSQAKPEKDFTDTELALRWIEEKLDYRKYDSINIFGATGSRLDHEFNNFLNLFLPEYKNILNKVKIFDLGNIVNFFNPGDYLLENEYRKKYLGFVVLNNIGNFSIHGAKYDLLNFSSKIDRVFASNEFLDNQSIKIHFDVGNVMAIYS